MRVRPSPCSSPRDTERSTRTGPRPRRQSSPRRSKSAGRGTCRIADLGAGAGCTTRTHHAVRISRRSADHVGALLDATAAVQKAHPDLEVAQAGSASLDAGINDKVGEDLASAESLSLPITFLILLVAFGAVIAAGIPVLLAITSVVTALGLYAPLSYLAPDSGTVANVVLLIGMAVGVDYSLFYLKREREERRAGTFNDRRDRDRGGDVRACRSGLGACRDGVDGGAVPLRRGRLHRTCCRLDPRGRSCRHRFAHRVARAACQARALG